MGSVIYPPQGTLPYKTSGASNMIQGVAAFMENFNKARDAEKSKSLQEFQMNIQLLQAGVPVDIKKTMKLAQKAGIPLDTSEPVQQVQAAGPSQPPTQLSIPTGGGQSPSVPGMPTQQVTMPGAPPPMVTPQQPGPSNWQRFSQGMGWSSSFVSMNSPAAASLAMMQQRGMNAQQAADLDASNKKKVGLIFEKALEGDPKAQEMARGLRLFEQIPEYEWIYDMLITKKGMTPEEAANAIWNVKASSLTGQILDYEAQMARLSADQQQQIFENTASFMEQFPYAPYGAASMAAKARALGDAQGYQIAINEITKTPTKGQIAENKELFDRWLKGEQLDVSKGNLDVSRGQLGLEGQKFLETKIQNAKQVAQEQFGMMTQLMQSERFKKAPQAEKDALLKGAVDAVNAHAGQTLLTTSDVKTWFNMLTGGTRTEIGYPKVNVPNQEPRVPAAGEMPQWGQQQWSRPPAPAFPGSLINPIRR